MDVPALILRILKRFRPREGWIPFLLALIALVSPPLAMAEASRGQELSSLFILTILGLLAGLWAARRGLPAHWTMLLAGVVGAGLTVVFVAKVLPPVSLVFRELGYSLAWIGRVLGGETDWTWPFVSVGNYMWRQLSALVTRLSWWSQSVSANQVAQDDILFVLLATWLAWVLATFASWQIFGRRAMLLGLLPSGMAMAVIAFFREGMAIFYLMTFLFCTLCLVAIGHLARHRERWDRIGTDYPSELGLELSFMLLPGLCLLFILAAVFPVIHPAQVRQAFWRLMEEPWSEVEAVSERLFGPMEQIGGSRGRAGGVLPRQQLLGAGPDLADRIVLYVTSSDPPPLDKEGQPVPFDPDAPRRYWRGVTYDTYTGQGWANTPVEQQPWPADQPLSPLPAAGPELYQRYQLLRDEPWLYAANQPVQIDRDVISSWRAPDDLAWLESEAWEYAIISHPLEPSAADLQQAQSMLHPELAERYLTLPDNMPERVVDLAHMVAGDHDTQYGQAEAIEYFLRSYTYTLDLPPPPENQDVVDYFLFEQQEGYCDYYASSMVVMARAVGIPARLASGYAQGTYDHATRRWVVTEKDAHSWVEIHFDGIGWVEFEPTAGLPALARTGAGTERPAVPPLPEPTRRRAHLPWALLAIVILLGLLLAAVTWIWRSGQREAGSASDLVRDRYQRLLGWGIRLGLPLKDGQTPLEYGHSLGDELGARGQDSTWSPIRQAATETPPAVSRLAEAFVRAQYAPSPMAEKEGWQIRALWTRLRRHLWWLWLGRR
jgi:transglutaminase-like putative cysteine protease